MERVGAAHMPSGRLGVVSGNPCLCVPVTVSGSQQLVTASAWAMHRHEKETNRLLPIA